MTYLHKEPNVLGDFMLTLHFGLVQNGPRHHLIEN